ncbi:class I SAM-dependent methyltransferase [Oceanibaculum nanhaiense]|uniref:class I SAM-dependent methyltransferase n=1 Tax=Oceanibaculum nanhaiense TaxID=1909734 RepID=UPI00396F03B6
MSVDDPRLKRHPLGFLQAAEMPTAEQLRDYYASYYRRESGNYRKSYDARELAFLDAKLAQRAALAQQIRGSAAPGRFLDAGCGEGFALAWFQRAGWRVEGIDHSMAGIEAMNQALAESVTAGDLFALLDARIGTGERYDLVWLTNVLEHVTDPVGLLEKLRRLVASGGVLAVTVPNDGSAYQKKLLEDGQIDDRFWIALPDHLAYFTGDSLRATTQATGWACREIIADFPIDWFLLHEGSNYVRDRAQGKAAHRARVELELLLADQPVEAVNAYYAALARLGLGRNLTAFLTPRD